MIEEIEVFWQRIRREWLKKGSNEIFIDLRTWSNECLHKKSTGQKFLFAFLVHENPIDLVSPDQQRSHQDFVYHAEDSYEIALWLRTGMSEKATAEQDGEKPDFAKKLEAYTLGERRQHAKGFEHSMLELLLLDSDTIVGQNLMNNPRIDESQMLKLLSKRPQNPALLNMAFCHGRWQSRRRIQECLVWHQQTPSHIRCGLMNFMPRQTLKEMWKENHWLILPMRERYGHAEMTEYLSGF